jgi:hypothetical protein
MEPGEMYPVPAKLYIVDWSWSRMGFVELWEAVAKFELHWDYPFYERIRVWK